MKPITLGVLIMTAAAAYALLPKSVRNNNPLNIRESAGDTTQWDGEASDDRDPEFEEFQDPVMGFRAAGKILLNYQRLYGLTTISQIINRWAPPEDDNDTGSYAQHVAQKLNVNPNSPITLSETNLARLMHVMSTHETGRFMGYEFFSYGQALAGAKLALAT